jgi:PAS domain S-box-containing protein
MDHSTAQLIESVLGGGGEMGERMRAFDWSTTALGPLDHWPQSLRICVRIILGSGYPMAICWGPDYTLLYNDAQRVLFGTKHPSALGRSTSELFPEAWDAVGPMYDRVMREGRAYTTLDDRLFPLNRHGYLEECYFALSYSPIPDDNGQVGGVFVTGIDTTERVIEDRRRQVLRDVASRTAEARYEDDVWRVSAHTLGEHRVTIPFAFLYARRPTERNAYLVGPSIEPDALDPSVVDCTRQNLWGFSTALPGEGIVVALRARASVLPSNSWPVPPEKAAVVPIRLHGDSEAAGFLVAGIHPGRAFDDPYRQFLRRIADQIAIGLASARAYELQLQRADALAEIDRAKTAFFGNVSHEFRTPLQLMLGPLEEVLTEGSGGLGPQRHQQLLTVRRNALRLLKLVNNLLEFARLEAGRVQAVYQPTDLVALTSDIATMFRSAMDSAGLQFSVDCQPITEPIFVDRSMWEKIVLNLLSNAFKFTFQGQVAISLKPAEGAVELQVRDTGVGIPDDQRETVFDRFHRIERTSARTHEGTGIGLALVQELVTLHGGSVRVESAVGLGSTFTVTIPRGKEHLPAESIHGEESSASSDIGAQAYVEEALRWLPEGASAPVAVAMLSKLSPLGSSRADVLEANRELIVVADDNADMREYLTRLLGDRYEVHAVADGQQALEAVRQWRPALVLADVMMPQLDGFGLLRAIRDDSALCGTPVILVSARAGEESRVEGLQADADDYLVKPFTSRELLARVATHMRMADLRRVTAEHEQRLHDLAERERESRMIVDSIPGLVSMFSPSGEIEVLNQRMLEYFGKPLEEMRHWEENDIIHREDLPRVVRVFAQAIASQEPLEYEARLRRFDGVYRWFQVRAFPARDSTGCVARWYTLITDIDDRKLAEDALRTDIEDRKRAEAEISALKDQLYKENLVLRDEVDRTSMFEEIVGTSAALQPLLTRVAKVAGTDSTVLITGETGTGKELVARAIHRRSARASRAFVSVNCAAIPRELIASELFGHEKGAFTGANQRRLGRFELAHGGTIFLDEVGELPMETQVALLRVLQEREFERVGGSAPVRADVRVIAATNRDLPAAIEAGMLRSDLFYRLNVFPIAVPSLRERTDDIPLLVEYFIDRYARNAGKRIRRVSKRTLDHLRSYPWPGNVRELQNVIERSVIVCETEEFTVDESWLSARPPIEAALALSGTVAAHEKGLIEDALRACGGRVYGPAGAAARLGIPRSTLESKIRALRINKNRFRG